MSGRGAGKVLADQSKARSKTGKKTLRQGLQRIVRLGRAARRRDADLVFRR